MTYATTRRKGANSEINKLYPEDRAVHEWYRFVLSFPPHLVRDYVQRFGIKKDQRVLDPFCGTGTVLVEAKKLGIASVGIEANPMAHFASAVKIDWTPDPDGLIEHARSIADRALTRLKEDGIEDTPPFAESSHPSATLRTLPEAGEALVLSGSLSPLPMHKALVLLECLEQRRDERFYRHERLALAKSVVFASSNLRFGPEVGVSRPKPDAPVIMPWLSGVSGIAADLHVLQRDADIPASVYCADAREMPRVLEPESIDAVITSPPYPNEKDYTRTTRLEAVLLGFLQTKADLRSLKKGMLRSNTRTVYAGDNDDDWVAHNEEIQRIAREIEARRIAMKKTSGFERLYARVTKLYFGGIARHLAELRVLLRPNAQLAYVVGDQASYLRVMIPTGHIIAEIAHSLGYEAVSIDLFRTRLATATKAQLREEVVVLRWPGNETHAIPF